MSPEQELLEKWRSLDKQKQEEVLDFVNFIHAKRQIAFSKCLIASYFQYFTDSFR